MEITILTLFPGMFQGPFSESIIKIAQEKKLLEIALVNIRDFGMGSHRVVDDKPYGGGLGMILRVDVLDRAISSAKDPHLSQDEQKVVLLDPHGPTFTQKKAQSFSKLKHLILVCAHYEGVDERVKKLLIDEQVSVGDFIVTGGEIPAMLVTDAVGRLITGVLKGGVTENETFSKNHELYLEYPHYTRPAEYKGEKVPDVLLSGNHAKITSWKEAHSSVKKDLTGSK